jgi:hypothetical protein
MALFCRSGNAASGMRVYPDPHSHYKGKPMKRLSLAFAAVLLGVFSTATLAQNFVRGTITAFDGKIITVKSRDGRDLKLELPESVQVAVAKPFSLADVKPGMPLGVTTVKRGDDVVAIDVRPIPPTAPMGLSPYDLQPNSTMTNAMLEGTAKSAAGDELTLNYKSGSVKVLVTPQTTMSTTGPGTRADIKPGETIFAAVKPGTDGTSVVGRIVVSKDGVKPTA